MPVAPDPCRYVQGRQSKPGHTPGCVPEGICAWYYLPWTETVPATPRSGTSFIPSPLHGRFRPTLVRASAAGRVERRQEKGSSSTCVHTVCHNKTKLYRLHSPDLARRQGGLRMIKNGADAAGLVRESAGADSAAHSPLQAKLSLARGDRVQMSALGRARHPSYGDCQGLIVGQGSPNS